jgi:CheY-like chemotaxis protein
MSRAHKAGEAELLGVIINAAMEHSAASLDGFLSLDGISGIPIGIDKDATDFGRCPPYQARLAPHAVSCKSNEDAEDAVKLYRRLLANTDGDIEIIEIGYLQAFAALLLSPPDEISDLSGLDLVRKKVTRVWVMAGKWDKDGERENNFARNGRSISGGKITLDFCPVPITFLGFEVGVDVFTGGSLPHTDHLWQALDDHGSGGGRCSWDPMLTLLALTGDCEKAGYREIEEATNGEEALVKIDRAMPDAVIVDLWLSRIDGIGVIRNGRALHHPEKTPIFILVSLISNQNIFL